MTATDELLPCPFCGGEVDLCKQKRELLDGSTYCYWHVIHRCPHGNYSETKFCGTKAEAIRAWNRRASNRTTTRNGRYRTKYGRRVPLCECCGYSIGDLRWKFCPSCGAEVVDHD